jgi:hypothetical protein
MITHEPHILRLYLMRLLYLLNFLFLGFEVWPTLLHHPGPWDPVKGVALSFWAALSALCVLGIRYPLKMVPVLLMQFLYKLIWLVAVALPAWPALRSAGLTGSMEGGIIADLVVIPWVYVWVTFVRQPGDRWRISARPSMADVPVSR